MARIVLADDGIEFDDRTARERPLGGVESSVVFLAEELARRGHEMIVCNRCPNPGRRAGVEWRLIHGDGAPYSGVPAEADLYIANRGDRLIPLAPEARRVAFWTHNPARYVLKARYLWKLWRRRPVIVFIGDYHAATCPAWVPDGGRKVIPYGIPDLFRAAMPLSDPPAPRAVFTSNPLRSLDWLLDLWGKAIRPRAPGAELHIFAGAATYGAVGAAHADAMGEILTRAAGMKSQGVVVRGPVPKAELVAEFRQARAMLYRGDLNETFCLAVGEAQASGVPAVVGGLGSVVERVIDGETGFIAREEGAFVEAAVRVLTDDALWRRQHQAALLRQRAWGWPEAAAAFEALMV
ncbi:MAG: glycosyltransferase family 4 protein [Alphaproteobacteria bacterium]|nr:glycosyltransferase family 4 protein [Alphaproteobacteria bacterium]